MKTITLCRNSKLMGGNGTAITHRYDLSVSLTLSYKIEIMTPWINDQAI